MHITEVHIWKAKHLVYDEKEYLNRRHRLEVKLPDGTVLPMDSNITLSSVSYPVNLVVKPCELKECTEVTISFLEEDGTVDYQEVLNVYTSTNMVKSTKNLSVSVLFVGTSKLVFLKGW